MTKVTIDSSPDSCWEWIGAKAKGYGTLNVSGRMKQAHRLCYEEFVGPIPVGLEIDHLCRNRACINPKHLEPVTREVNIQRGAAPEATRKRHRKKTHCPSGHPYSGSNLSIKQCGRRRCKECNKLAMRLKRSKSNRQDI